MAHFSVIIKFDDKRLCFDSHALLDFLHCYLQSLCFHSRCTQKLFCEDLIAFQTVESVGRPFDEAREVPTKDLLLCRSSYAN